MDRLRATAQYAAGFALFLLLWWGGSRVIGPAVLPSPQAVFSYLAAGGVGIEFLTAVSRTVARGILGFSVAWVVALPVGLAMGRSAGGERIGFLPFLLLQSAPPLFWVTPLVLWLGTDGLVAPVVAFLVSLPLLTVHAATAVRHIPEYEFDVFSVYAPRRLVIARELYLPYLLPALKSNIHLGLLVSVKASMLAEWFAAQNGFGRIIRVHYQFFAMTEFVAWALLFLILVGGISFGVRATLKRVLPSRRPTQATADSQNTQSTNATPAQQTAEALQPAHSSRREAKDVVEQKRQIEVDRLSFGYGRQPVFEGLSIVARKDRPVVLVGESGCGKTTLLKCIAGIHGPWAGTIAAPGPVALVFQQDALLAHRDSIGNVLLPALPDYDGADVERARDCLKIWGLADHEAKFPEELSGGMRKRLAMARAWFLNPASILLDEPFVNLDKEARAALWRLLLEEVSAAELPAVIVTHYPEELAGYDVDVRPWVSLFESTG